MQRIRPIFHLKWFSQSFLESILRDILIFKCSRPFRIFLWLPLKLVLETALQALAQIQVLQADLFTSSGSTLSAKASTTALSSVKAEGLLLLTSSITTTQNQKSRQLMSGDLAGQAMVVRSTWKSARACRAVAGTSFEGSLKKILKGLEHYNIKMSYKIESRNERENLGTR